MAEIEKVGKIRVKIVERSGDKLVDFLNNLNPQSQTDCDRKDCWLCVSTGEESGEKGMCYKRCLVYETFCVTCEKGEDEK